jgi:hypothetical protein
LFILGLLDASLYGLYIILGCTQLLDLCNRVGMSRSLAYA